MTEEYWLELAAAVLANTALTTRFSRGHSACGGLPEVRRATGFAAWKHTGQFRKGEGKTPYIHHPIEVAAILSEAGAVEDNDLLQAALLHDTIEDTADKISNVFDVAFSTPVDWPPERQLAYFDWASQVVAGLRGCNAALEALFDEQVARSREFVNGN